LGDVDQLLTSVSTTGTSVGVLREGDEQLRHTRASARRWIATEETLARRIGRCRANSSAKTAVGVVLVLLDVERLYGERLADVVEAVRKVLGGYLLL